MRKNNILYTVNRWNQPLFVDNIFDEGGQIASFDKAASSAYGADYGEAGHTLNDYMNSKNAFGISKVDNPFSKGNLMNTFSKGNMTNLMKGSIGAVGNIVGSAAKKFLSNGLNSGAGNGVAAVGGAVGSLVGKVNPVLGAAVSAATGIIGGGINAAFGTGVDQAKKRANEEGTAKLATFNSSASSFDDIKGPQAVNAVQNAYKSGFLNKGWAKKRNSQVKRDRLEAYNHAYSSVENNIDNLEMTQMDNMLANYAAFGGLLDMSRGSQGAIDYGFMTDYLSTKNRSNDIKDKESSNIFGSLANTPVFALGGDLQTNGSDFSTGLSEINAGSSHELNPYGGVQVGKDAEGTPNLVEEGETIFDDYVYSNRIKVDKQTKERFHLSKNADITYAALSKKLQRESTERPNDAISQRGLTKQMHDLAEEQERQKNEEQTQKMQEIFNSLPPEQQAEIMQQLAQQEQQAQIAEQQNAQQQGMEGQPMENMQEQPTEQQMVGQQQAEQPIQEGVQMNACGGKINRYDKGGEIKKKIYKLLNLYTDSDFDKWAYNQKLDKITDWENISKNGEFMTALGGVNPIVADAISRGYDFGTYIPSKNNALSFDFTHGGWGAEDYNAWNGSTDAAWEEAVKKSLVRESMNSEEIGKALSQTDAYKRGTDWLKNSEDNRLTYLQQILNSKDAPQAAKDYAAKYVDTNGWLKDADRDYDTIFKEVRSTHPGTYWKTPKEMLRDNQVTNYVQNEDGSIEEIIGDVPKDWLALGDYSWMTDKGDYKARYYKRPTASTIDEVVEESGKVVPKHKPTWGRTAGLFGPVVGLGMQALGIGKPNYSRMDSALATARQSPALAHAQTIGNYLKYDPMDIWYEQNRMNANSRATDRAIINNSSPLGTKMAGLLANNYNSQIASGDLYRKALEYNDAKNQAVADFNRKTDIFNADALTNVSTTNAQLMNRDKQFNAQMMAQDAAQRMAADASWYQGIYGNVNNFFKGLGAWGKENAQNNMIADMAADGLFGTITNKQNIAKDKIAVVKRANGGRIRRNGLIF